MEWTCKGVFKNHLMHLYRAHTKDYSKMRQCFWSKLDKTTQYTCKTKTKTYIKHNFNNIKQHYKIHTKSWIIQTNLYLWFHHASSDFFVDHDPNQTFPNIIERSDQENVQIDWSFRIVLAKYRANMVITSSSFLSLILVDWTLSSESFDGQRYSSLSILIVSLWLSGHWIWSSLSFKQVNVTSTWTLNKLCFSSL